jgi:hypothetical protein
METVKTRSYHQLRSTLILRENKKNRKIFAKKFGVSKKVVFLHPQIERLNAIKEGH